jgi:NAD+ synthase
MQKSVTQRNAVVHNFCSAAAKIVFHRWINLSIPHSMLPIENLEAAWAIFTQDAANGINRAFRLESKEKIDITHGYMKLSIAMIQSSSSVGNVVANVARIAVFYRMAVVAKADLVVFPEMTIPGYPSEDLFLNAQFQDRCMSALEECARMTSSGPAMLVGTLWRDDDVLYNAVFLLDQGKIASRQYKCHLPNYGIFDEKRYFEQGRDPDPIEWNGTKLGLLICEDMWHSRLAKLLKQKGAELLISVNASPFETGKPLARERVAAQRTHETGLALLYVNQIGGHDELIFDGHSFVLGTDGEPCARLEGFREDFKLLQLERQDSKFIPTSGPFPVLPHETDMIYRAMVLGLRDFTRKNGFSGIVLGMSGGIDSALSAALAVDAVGRERVRALMLPSPYTSQESIEDASECAGRLGIRLDTVSIEPGMQAFDVMLSNVFGGQLSDLAIGDNQPRLRGGILMALSRKENLLLLNTGNKSEMAVGYTTMYGDMCGHYAVLKDIYKTSVYELAAWRNTQGDVIPLRVLAKAPTAELFHGQTDQDTLPPYATLDKILYQLVENRLGIQDVAAQGFDLELVEAVSGMLHRSEYKRRQSAPGAKISCMSFGGDRRYPISNGWYVEQHERLARRTSDQKKIVNHHAH